MSIGVRVCIVTAWLVAWTTGSAGEAILKSFDKDLSDEMAGAQFGQGELTVQGARSVLSAAQVLQEFKLRLEDYVSVSVQEAEHSYHVLFTKKPFMSRQTGSSPGEPPDLLIRIDKKSFAVLGVYRAAGQ
jgi:hypothetical protein